MSEPWWGRLRLEYRALHLLIIKWNSSYANTEVFKIMITSIFTFLIFLWFKCKFKWFNMHLCSNVKNTYVLTVLLQMLLLYSQVISWVLGKLDFACCTGRISHRPTYKKSLLQTPISHSEIKSLFYDTNSTSCSNNLKQIHF